LRWEQQVVIQLQAREKKRKKQQGGPWSGRSRVEKEELKGDAQTPNMWGEGEGSAGNRKTLFGKKERVISSYNGKTIEGGGAVGSGKKKAKIPMLVSGKKTEKHS